jgi:Undecaprenyl-phosphate glucose phosphotransferase
MSDATELMRGSLALERRQARRIVLGPGFGTVAAALDAGVIVGLSVLAGAGYHLYGYGETGLVDNYVLVGLLVALSYVAAQYLQGRYDIAGAPTETTAFRRIFLVWNLAFFCLLALGFLAKLTDAYSRGAIVVLYLAGLPALVLVRHAFRRIVVSGFRRGWLVTRSVLLIGTEANVRKFLARALPHRFGLRVVGIELLPETGAWTGNETVARLNRAIASARGEAPSDVLLLAPPSEAAAIRQCANALMSVPAAIGVAPDWLLDSFTGVRISDMGGAKTLTLVRPPLTALELMAKRALDLAGASVALVLLAPVLLVIALLIRLDSAGPVFFLQRRHGFNERAFRILKFRTMTVHDDGPVVRQATRDDPRVTRIGRFLRRWNLDELPQLLNVLKGDMSLVGPRPHALNHNHEFERRIGSYARRHNVKPGITGWAQINGHRGETDTTAKLRARVEHDLHYIDNWSLWFDIYILALTVLSPRAFRNAY